MNDLNIKKMITYKHLEKLLTCQEYFVWNSKINNYFNSLEFEEEQSNGELSMWELISDFDLEELDDYEFIEVIKNGYDKVNQLFLKQIKERAKIENKEILVINEKSNEIAYKKTIESLNNEKIDWIINPIFIYDDLIVRFSIYDRKNKKAYSLIHGSKTKLKNYIKAYFDFNVLKKIGIELNEYYFYTYDNKYSYDKKDDLKFNYSKYCWTQKTGPGKDIKQTIEENAAQMSIIDKIKSGHIQVKISKPKNKPEKVNLKLSLYIEDFDRYVNEIRLAKNIDKFNEISYKDLTEWGENPNFTELFPYEKIGIEHVCGYLLKKRNLLSILNYEKPLSYYKSKRTSLKLVIDKQNHFDFDIVKDYISRIKNTKCVWYDFEGFSMPYVIHPFTKPYQQLIFQVSIIKTNKEQIIGESNNIVYDPKNLSINDFKNTIDSIYLFEADHYIVFNQSYEIPKLHNMVKILSDMNDPDHLEYERKVNEIKEKTIDLLDLFKVKNSDTEIPPIFLHKLLGFSSIKKIEKLITSSKLKLEVMITPYKELEVQNGLMAMNKAIQRYVGAIGDLEWEKTKNNLAKYCENDVRAMIMVYYFAKMIYEHKNFE